MGTCPQSRSRVSPENCWTQKVNLPLGPLYRPRNMTLKPFSEPAFFLLADMYVSTSWDRLSGPLRLRTPLRIRQVSLPEQRPSLGCLAVCLIVYRPPSPHKAWGGGARSGRYGRSSFGARDRVFNTRCFLFRPVDLPSPRARSRAWKSGLSYRGFVLFSLLSCRHTVL